MARLVIVGAGGHARVVADAADACGAHTSICFLDDRFPELQASGPWPVIGKIAELEARLMSDDAVVVAIGHPQLRMELVARLDAHGVSLASVIHPRATVSRHAVVGDGAMIFAGACINVGARLGRSVIVNTGATVDHDCELGDGVHVAPGANLSGNVRVGKRSWVGVGTSVKQGIVIGDDVTIGAGAAVVRDIPHGSTAVGVPARAR